jgi:hypothetical protein
MKLESVLKTSLDELRMQMLGSQVLFGFQFQGLFQCNFETLPISARTADVVAMAMMILVLGLIVAVPCQHRIVEEGEATLSNTISTVGASLTTAILLGLWFVLPLALRGTRNRRPRTTVGST